MLPEDADYLKALAGGPAILFLGQGLLSVDIGFDPLLAAVRRKFSASDTAGDTYDLLFATDAGRHPENSLAWLDERSRRIGAPAWLEQVAAYQWSSVYSSAIDSAWAPSFRLSWREIQPIYNDRYQPSDPRNRLVLHCTYLWGSVGQPEPGERAPLTRYEFVNRRVVAIALARRLTDLVTPRGTLTIEAYAGTDWFTAEDLIPVLDGLGAGQAHIFSATEPLLTNAIIEHLIQSGRLVAHKTSLAEVLRDGADSGQLALETPAEPDFERAVRFGGRIHSVPRDLWVRLRRSAIVLDDDALARPGALSDDATYQAFRTFLGNSEGVPDWSAHGRAFAFRRNFEAPLTRRVREALAKVRPDERPFIVHGATGTGKSTALRSLAYDTATSGSWPVLVLNRRAYAIQLADIDRFCQWSEDRGAAGTLIIWDAMLSPEEYSETLRRLAGRGRKIVMVGSAYKLRPAKGDRLVLAPPEFQPGELERLGTFLNRFSPDLSAVLRNITDQSSATFLVALYRILPPTRAAITAGVAGELTHAEGAILTQVLASRGGPVADTELARALVRAGFLSTNPLAETVEAEIGGELVSPIQELSGLVLVPGKYGLHVPLELLLRTLGSEGYENFAHLIDDIDLLRWIEDSVGNVAIGARSTLEAQLLVRARLGTASSEVAFASRLLEEVRGVDLDRDPEMEFAVELVRALGAGGPDEYYFAPVFPVLAAALKRLRTTRGVRNPRLMLQEANLMREWVIHRSTSVEPTAAVALLAEAESLIEEGLDLLPNEPRSRVLRNHLYVELASAYSAHSKFASLQGARSEASALFGNTQRALLEARAEDRTNYYPIDVLAWSTRNAVEAHLLEPDAEAEAIAEVVHLFELTDAREMDSRQAERLLSREQEFNDLVGNHRIADEAFQRLVRRGSAAGIYLRAYRMADLAALTLPVDDAHVPALMESAAYLQSYPELVSTDVKCMNLTLDLWWLAHTRNRPFSGEREALPFRNSDWTDLLAIVDRLLSLGETYRTVLLLFLRGLALFHLGQLGAALEVYREVERRSDEVKGRRRIVKSYLASQPDGSPRRFHGIVKFASQDNLHGEVQVEELRQGLMFIPRDFGLDNPPVGLSVGEFHIAFNFVRPLCDPLGFYEGRRGTAAG